MVVPASEARDAPPSTPLSSPTLAAVAEHVASLRLKLGREPRVIALLGAGASASAGLPDWRSPGSGLYASIRERALADGDAELAACPGLVFSLSHFRRDPAAFYRTLREHCLWPGTAAEAGGEEDHGDEAGAATAKEPPPRDEQAGDRAAAGDQDDEEDDPKRRRKKLLPPEQHLQQYNSYRPTAAHHLLAALEKRGALLRAYTQNVDGLEFGAGCSDEVVVQAHGGFREAHCAACGRPASPYAVMEALAAEEGDEAKAVPQCEACGERAVKPAVVLFGERLPARFHRLRLRDLPQCELLIVLGTALAVEPFASLLRAVPAGCPRVLVNRCAVREEEEEEEGEGGGFRFVGSGACRDVAVLGECDDGCLALAEALGGKGMREEVERGWRGGGVSAAAAEGRRRR